MDTITPLIDSLNSVDFASVGAYVFSCFGLFWLVVSSLTARDAFLRYQRSWLWAGIWFVVIAFTNILGVILYLLVRPDDYPSISNPTGEPVGGINVPMANFVGKDGVVNMSIQLKINSAELAKEMRDMRLDIDWVSTDKNKQLTMDSLAEETREVESKISGLNKMLDKIKLSAGAKDTDSAKTVEKKVERNFAPKPELKKEEKPTVKNNNKQKDNKNQDSQKKSKNN